MAAPKEQDLRGERYESTLRAEDFQRMNLNDGNTHIKERVFSCSKCRRGFAEKSRYCPWCDTKTMGELKPVPESERAKLKAREAARLRARYGR